MYEEKGTETPGSTSGTLLDRVKAGDEESRERLVKLYQPLVYHRYLANVPQQDRPDIAQAVFVTVFAKIGGFEKRFDGPAFRGWLYRIAFNKVGDYIRKTDKVKRLTQKAGNDQPHPIPPDGRDQTAEKQIVSIQALELVSAEFEPATFEAASRSIRESRLP